MSEFPVGLILELVVVGLLCVTVAYCFVLNRKLQQLRSAQNDMRLVVQDLNMATQHAENAIAGLRATTDEAEHKLDDKLHKAKLLTHNLALFVERSNRNIAPEGDGVGEKWRQAG